MIKREFDKYSEFILSMFAKYNAGEGMKIQAITAKGRNEFAGNDYQMFIFVYCQLLSNDILSESNLFVKLTDKGFRAINGGAPINLYIDFKTLFALSNSQKKREIYYNYLWRIIGVEKDCLCFVPGIMFYNAISPFITGSSPRLNSYIETRKKNGESTSRYDYYRDLFFLIQDEDIEKFFEKLSELYNREEQQINTEEKNEEMQVFENKNQQIMKSTKVFISHASANAKAAKALVELLEFLHIDSEEQLFCSSVTGYDVKVGKDIYETILKEYQNHNLFMIYLLSHEYYSKPICLNEMGAGWVLKTDYQTILLPGFTIQDMGNSCIGTNTIAIILDDELENIKSRLNQFKDNLIEKMNLKQPNASRWEQKRDKFIQTIKSRSKTDDTSKLEKTPTIQPKASISAIITPFDNPRTIMITNEGTGMAENLEVDIEGDNDNLIITGLESFPLEYLKPKHTINLTVHLCMGCPDKIKMHFKWYEGKSEFTSEDIIVIN